MPNLFRRDKVPKKELEKLRQWYKEELLRRDREIERLKKEREVLLKTSIKQAEFSIKDRRKNG